MLTRQRSPVFMIFVSGHAILIPDGREFGRAGVLGSLVMARRASRPRSRITAPARRGIFEGYASASAVAESQVLTQMPFVLALLGCCSRSRARRNGCDQVLPWHRLRPCWGMPWSSNRVALLKLESCTEVLFV